MSEQTFVRRVSQASVLAEEAGIDAVIITPGTDLKYFSGISASSHERLFALVIPAHQTPFVVLPALEAALLRNSVLASLKAYYWEDGEDPYQLIVEKLAVADPALAVGSDTPALHVIPLSSLTTKPLILANAIIRQLRMIKDPAEIVALQEAGAAIDRVQARIPDIIAVGKTERDIAEEIAAAIVAEGHDTVEFVIVGSGPNSADPHHEVSDRVIEPGDIIVIDIGGSVPEGYNSDTTRMYSVGEPDPSVAEKIEILRQAQAAAVAAIKPGVTAHSIDAVARDYLTQAGLGDYFPHRTGHGIGLSVHEEPYIVEGNELTLQSGMTFSVEPGIYFPGQWGARIEDIVLVADHGAIPLNHQDHQLVIIEP